MCKPRLFLAAVAVIALHVLDDSFLAPQPGTSAGDHLAGGLVPVALLAAAAFAYPRARAGVQAVLALVTGFFGVIVSIEALYYAGHVGPSGDDWTGLLALPAGLALLGLGAWTLWRSRRLDERLARRYARRALAGTGGLVAFAWVLAPLGFGYVTTHTARAVVPAAKLGAAYEKVSFRTSDGLTLRGWYVPSRNGAAVIAFPGRKGSQTPARILARHGYGVLLFDRRGEGESEGDANAWGWGGDRDVRAAAAWLRRRPDVEPDRVGGIGLSVGGEMMLEAQAETHDLDALIAEGAGARAYSEDVAEASGLDKVLSAPMAATKTAAVAVFSNTAVPPNLENLMPRIAPRPVMLIQTGAPNEVIARRYYRAARNPKSLWRVAEAGHMGSASARPREYERRVVGFFDRTLRPTGVS